MKKILSLLLVAVMVAGMLTTFVSAATLPNLGKDGTLGGMPDNAENIHYLSDIYKTHVVDQLNKTVTLDTGYHNYVMAFVNGSRYQIGGDKVDANGNRTVDGVTFNKDDIALGYNGTKFEKGLGVHPDVLGNPDRYIVYDVSKLNVNRFYAVVGGTGTNITHPSMKDHYLEFELLGSKSATYDANSFELLADAKDIRSYLVAEFDVDITGYNFIKLVIRLGANSLNNQSCGGVWGGACVYTGTAPAGPNLGEAAQPEAYTPSADGSFAGMPSDYKDSKAYLSDFDIVKSDNNGGKPSTLNVPYGKPDDVITMGAMDTMFWSGIGMHPAKGDVESYTIFDVSELNANRFYSAVGITNVNGKNGAGHGVLFGVFGDYGDGKYVLLAQSTLITKTDAGEFDVDITGVKFLKLVVMCGGTNNASSACAWGDATVYSTTGDLTLPTEPTEEPTEKPTTKPTTKPTEKPTTPATTPVEEPTSEFPIGIVIGIAAAVVVAVVVVIIVLSKKKKAE